MKLLVNGFPKHGTHVLMKACELLGCPGEHDHWPYGKLPEFTHHVFIKRDPRNALISLIRSIGEPLTQGIVISKIRKFMNAPLREELAQFSPWLNTAFVVRFEDLIKDDKEMRRIAAYLEVPYLDDAFPNLPGHTRTWSGKYSDHRSLWTPEIEKVWQKECPEVLSEWGYS